MSLLPDWITPRLLEPTDGILYVLVFDRSQERKASGFASKAWGGPIPDGSFYEVKPGVFVESPAFMFLHAARILSLQNLIAFGDELCGLYSFYRWEKRGFRKRKEPLITIDQLEKYLANAPRCNGIRRALAALNHIVERSASPMETYDEMTMCLPCRFGGYGLYRPIMNQEIILNPRAKRIAKRNRCYLDMGYLHFELDIEHHGKLDHSSEEDRSSDRARVNALREMGIEVVELTNDQVKDLFAYEFIIMRIARVMGKRLRRPTLGATPERLSLRACLHAWNQSYGKIR